jgi:hypothetical protein
MNPIEEETRWQSAWMRELHREHQDICWRYRVALPLPAIEITGSARQWGAWTTAGNSTSTGGSGRGTGSGEDC